MYRDQDRAIDPCRPLRHTTETSARRVGRDDDTIQSTPLAPGAVPLRYVADEEPGLRHFLSPVLDGSGIDNVEFADGAMRGLMVGAARQRALARRMIRCSISH